VRCSGLGEANVLRGLGDLEVDAEHPDVAHRYYAQARLLYQKEHSALGEANVDYDEGLLPCAREETGRGRSTYRESGSRICQHRNEGPSGSARVEAQNIRRLLRR
jgi:hypothetical protein